MKKLFTLILIASLLASCSSENEEPSISEEAYALNPGPGAEPPRGGGNPREVAKEACIAAYYPFNGNANDHSSYENHGIVNLAQLTTDRHGQPDQAYYFSGNGDHIQIKDKPQLHLQDHFTLSVWINPDTVKTQWLLAKGTHIYDDPKPFVLGLNMFDAIYFSSNYAGSLNVNGYDTKKWYMVTAVYDYNTMKLYIDDKLVGTNTFRHTPIDYSLNGDLLIGRGLFFTHGFKGKIDDLRIYCNALDDDGVAFLYNSTK